MTSPSTPKRTAPPSEDPKPKSKAGTDHLYFTSLLFAKICVTGSQELCSLQKERPLAFHVLSTCLLKKKKKKDTELRQEGADFIENRKSTPLPSPSTRLAESAKADAIKARKELKETKEDLANINTKSKLNKAEGELVTLRGEMDSVSDWFEKQ
ncbi:hypothetical protein NW762_004842 [Fusarium torreyae]|uniref:Uncharacterized protein n=1 Tax=Fusarium torreyae TaxID=1237075 RepID=A0A9W8VHA5_9HYPO|nr:hypothetical protein NW762_004842 [Fusarium torreyae]